MRIPLGGGGTDVPTYYRRFGGFIVSAAIDKYVYISLNRLKTEDRIKLKYSQVEVVDSIQQIQQPLLRAALSHVDAGTALEIAALADIPAGTGMGSSGAFLISLLTALHAHKRQHTPTQALAEEACYVEMELAKQPVGKHDQYLAAFGGFTCLEIGTDGAVKVSPLRVTAETAEELHGSLLLYFTGIVRDSYHILEEQRAATEANDATMLDSLHATKRIGLEIRDALERGDLHAFGALLHEHWENKKRRSSRMTSDAIERAYARARDSGALGGKLMGAGGGGFLMLFVPRSKRAAVRAAVSAEGLREMPFAFDYDGGKVLLNI